MGACSWYLDAMHDMLSSSRLDGSLAALLVMAMLTFDPSVQRYVPEPMPEFAFDSPAMFTSLLLMAGAGFLLWRRSAAGD